MSNSKEAKGSSPQVNGNATPIFMRARRCHGPALEQAFLPTGSVNTVRNHPFSQSRATFQAHDKSEVKGFARFGLGLRV